MNILPIFQRSLPCLEYDIGCGLQVDDKEPSIPVVNAAVNEEDNKSFRGDINVRNSNFALLHQAVASAVSDGAIVSYSNILP